MPPSPRPSPGAVAAHLRRALDTADYQSLIEVLHPDVYWGPPDGNGAGCHGRSRVLSRCAHLHARGPRVELEETFTYPGAVVLGLRIHSTVRPATQGTLVYQVFDVTDGLITRITEYADRTEALDTAYNGAAVGLRATQGQLPTTGTGVRRSE